MEKEHPFSSPGDGWRYLPGGAKVMRILGPIMLGCCLLLGIFVGAYCRGYSKRKRRRGFDEELGDVQQKQNGTKTQRRLELKSNNSSKRSVKSQVRHQKKKVGSPIFQPLRPQTRQNRPWTSLVREKNVKQNRRTSRNYTDSYDEQIDKSQK